MKTVMRENGIRESRLFYLGRQQTSRLRFCCISCQWRGAAAAGRSAMLLLAYSDAFRTGIRFNSDAVPI